MKKKLIIGGIIAGVIAVAIAIVCVVNIIVHSDEISEEQWVLNQRTHINHLINLSENIDDVYTLYIMGEMSVGDFNSEMQIINGQYLVYLKEFEQESNTDKIKLGSETFLSKKGRQALEKLNQDYESLFKDTYTDAITPRTPEEVAYVKMAYAQQIGEHFAEYISAYQVILDTNPDVSEPEGNFKSIINRDTDPQMFSDSSKIESSAKSSETQSKTETSETSN